MKQITVKRWAVLFSILLIVQHCKSHKILPHPYAVEKDHTAEEEDIAEERNSLVVRRTNLDGILPNEKRNFVLTVLPALLISSSFGGLLLSCNQFAGDLADNNNKIKRLVDVVKNKRDEINLQWSEATSRVRYLERLNATLKILRQQMSLQSNLQDDLILLLDKDVYKKISDEEKRLEQEIVQNNETVSIDLDQVRANVASVLDYGLLIMVSSMSSLLLYAVNRRLLTPVWNHKTKVKVSQWIRQRATSGLRYQGFKTKFLGKVGNVPHKNAIKYKVDDDFLKNDLKIREQNQLKLQKILKRIKLAMGIVVAAGILIAQTVFVIQHAKQCKEAEDKSFKLIKMLEKREKNMTNISHNIKNLQEDVDKSYIEIANKLKASEFYEYIDDIYSIATKLKIGGSKEMQEASVKLYIFKLKMKALNTKVGSVEYFDIQSTVTKLVEALTVTNKHLKCLRDNTKVFINAIESCKRGVHYPDIFKTLLKEESDVFANCHQGNKQKNTEENFKIFLDNAMRNYNKSEVCIRNNFLIKEVVCRNYLNKMSNEENAKKFEKLNVADVVYITKRCFKSSGRSSLQENICADKAYYKSLAKILEIYNSYDKALVEQTYLTCNLIHSQETYICQEKNRNIPLKNLEYEFAHYPAEMVKSAFENCKFTASPKLIAGICTISKLTGVQDPNAPQLAWFTKNYGKSTVTQVLRNKCPTYNASKQG